MLSIRNLESSKQAPIYFAKDDYYHGSTQHQPSMWWGRGARMLGLEGEVERDAFEKALEGELPGDRGVGRKAGSERRPGFDLTFSAPKSVSLLALVHRSDDVVRAHESAVSEALAFMEKEAALTRATSDGVTRDEMTNNLVVARFSHDTSRDLDPQLHSHCVVINATRREDGQWRSISNERIYALKMVGGAIYRARLAVELQKIGYELERTHADGRFEVRGFKEQLEHFSTRRAAIEEALTERGLEGAIAAKQAALFTREAKKEVDRAELLDAWRSRADEIAISFPEPSPKSHSRTLAREAADRAVGFAIDHLSERRAVFDERRVLALALGRATGSATFRDVNAALERYIESRDLVEERGPTRNTLRAFTTEKTLATERALVASVLLQQGERDSILTPEHSRKALDDFQLTDGQRSAVELILSTQDGVVGVQGYAGTGKTTALSVVRSLAEEAGYEVRGFAPSAAAAAVLENEAGIPSQTVASHLIEGDRRASGPELWIVDEASMLGNKDALRIIETARRADARLVLVGDWDQLPSVDAGAPFRLLAKQGMALASMDEILRQRDPILRLAVEKTIARTNEELDLLAPVIHEIPDRSRRLDAVARAYLEQGPDESVLVLTSSNADRRALNERIREGLVAEGRLSGREHKTEILSGKGLTMAEAEESANYRVGDVVRFERAYKRLGIEKGEYLLVQAIDPASNTIMLAGKTVGWRPHREVRVEVYEKESRGLAVGDRIRWTRNDRAAARRNGELARVTQVHADYAIVIANGKEQRIHFGADRHWDHAYASTVHAAQGRTADSVIVHIDSARSEISGHESWYVGLSRARDGVRVFTDDAKQLPKVIQRSLAQEIALDSVVRTMEPKRSQSSSHNHSRELGR
jgi:conjugative relaxase-like TrwC/TraI family protein